MKVLRDTPFEVGFVATQIRPPAHALTLVVKATLALARTGVSDVAEEQRPVGGEMFYDDEPENSLQYDTDLAPIKLRGEFYVAGTCYAPGGRAVTQTFVSAQVGTASKTVAVFGDRYWRGTLPSEPEKFKTMPLRYERSFGGPGYDANPVGLGAVEVEKNGAKRRPLPNLENPAALVTAPSSRPEPAGLFPYPPGWKQRTRFAGTYDEVWHKTRWPAPAEDFDFAYFNSAPVDQQIQGYFRGDEEVVLQNLHPESPTVKTRLPGLRARLFAFVKGAGGAEEFREITLNLDTIVIDADKEELVLLWRGALGVTSLKFPEVTAVYALHEPIGTRRQPSEYRIAFERKLAAEAEPEEELAPEEPPGFEAPITPPGMPPAPEAAAVDDRVSEALKKLGVDPDAAPAAPAAPGAPAAPSLPAVPSADAAAAALAAGATVPEAVRNLLEEARREAEQPAPPPAPPEEDPAVRRARARELVLARYAAGQKLEGEDLTEVDLSGLSLPGIDLSGAIMTRAVIRQSSLQNAKLEGTVLSEADLSGSWFNNSVMVGVDLFNARAERVNWEGVDLSGAQAQGAVMTEGRWVNAVLAEADLTDARLAGGDFQGAKLDGANLSGTRIDLARFVRGSLVGTVFERTAGDDASFEGSDLTKANFSEGSVLPRVNLVGVKAAQSNWSGAELRKANLSLGVFERADFSEAVLAQATMDGCDFKSAVFTDAKLTGCVCLRSDAKDASFEGADLSHADLRGTSFFNAEFVRANVSRARLETANLQRTRLA